MTSQTEHFLSGTPDLEYYTQLSLQVIFAILDFAHTTGFYLMFYL